MKIIITGGAGFIGSHLAEYLIKKHKIIIIDNLSTGRIENIKRFKNKLKFIKAGIFQNLANGQKISKTLSWFFIWLH